LETVFLFFSIFWFQALFIPGVVTTCCRTGAIGPECAVALRALWRLSCSDLLQHAAALHHVAAQPHDV
jgi:hypothetical protein